MRILLNSAANGHAPLIRILLRAEVLSNQLYRSWAPRVELNKYYLAGVGSRYPPRWLWPDRKRFFQHFSPITQTHGQTTDAPSGNTTRIHTDKKTSYTTLLAAGTCVLLYKKTLTFWPRVWVILLVPEHINLCIGEKEKMVSSYMRTRCSQERLALEKTLLALRVSFKFWDVVRSRHLDYVWL